MMVLRWDVRGLIDAMGGAGEFARTCERKGYGTVTPKTVRKWRERRSIPPGGLAAAVLELSAQGRALAPYIETEATPTLP